MSIGEFLKWLYGGFVIVTDSKVGDMRTYAAYLPIPPDLIDEPLISISVEKKFTYPPSPTNPPSEVPTGYFYSTADKAPSFKIDRPPSKQSRNENEKRRREANDLKSNDLPPWAKQYPGFTLKRWQKLFDNTTVLNANIKEAFAAAQTYLDSLTTAILEKSIDDYDYFFTSDMTPEKGLADLWTNTQTASDIGGTPAAKIWKIMNELQLTPDYSADQAGLQKKYSRKAINASKKGWKWMKNKGIGAMKGIKNMGKNAWQSTKNTLKQAFGVPKVTTFGGVDLSSYSPSINGHKLISDSTEEAVLMTCELTSPVDYSRIRKVFKELKDNVSWVKPKDGKLIFYTTSGTIDEEVTVPSYRRIRDGQIETEMLLDRELKILDNESKITLIEVKGNKMILKY